MIKIKQKAFLESNFKVTMRSLLWNIGIFNINSSCNDISFLMKCVWCEGRQPGTHMRSQQWENDNQDLIDYIFSSFHFLLQEMVLLMGESSVWGWVIRESKTTFSMGFRSDESAGQTSNIMVSKPIRSSFNIVYDTVLLQNETGISNRLLAEGSIKKSFGRCGIDFGLDKAQWTNPSELCGSSNHHKVWKH